MDQQRKNEILALEIESIHRTVFDEVFNIRDGYPHQREMSIKQMATYSVYKDKCKTLPKWRDYIHDIKNNLNAERYSDSRNF